MITEARSLVSFKNRKLILTGFHLIIGLMFCTTTSFAADVYLSKTGTKTSGTSIAGDWSNSNCYGNLHAALAAMSGGDKLTIDDGTYTGTANSIQYNHLPPSGTSTAFTIIKARNIPCQNGVACNQPLKVTFDGLNGATFVLDTTATYSFRYVKYEGIHWIGRVQTGYGSSHNYFKQCSVLGAMTTGNGANATFAILGDYNVVEDCVFYGQGRYKVLFYKSSDRAATETGSNVCRRCVARHDYSQASETSNQQNIGTFCSYYNRNSAFLNTISIDGDSPAYFQDPSYDMPGSWYVPNDTGNHNLLVEGSIALNNAFGVGQTSSGSYGNVFRDIAAVKNGGGLSFLGANGRTVEDALIYGVDWNQFSGWRSATQHNSSHVYAQNNGIQDWNGTALVANNLIIANILATSTAVAASGASGNYLQTFGVNSVQTGTITYTTSANPIYHASTNPAGRIKYPVRSESGYGPTILYKLGKDGTSRGDTDWNTEQGALWPWPYEDWVKAQMASMPSNVASQLMPSATRGFCTATGKRLDGVNPVTMTSYIWEALGNPIPADIYNKTADSIPPIISTFIMPSTASNHTVNVNSFMATDNYSVTGYLITESATQPDVGSANWSTSPPTTYTFSSAGAKTAYAWAKDAAGNISAPVSQNVIVTILVPDTIPPSVSAFTIPENATTLTVPVLSFVATDNQSVTGYLINESATAPTAGASGWSVTAPATITFSSPGSKIAYAWAKDAAGNISSSIAAPITISVQQSGASYYLSSTGVDTNSCSQEQPCRQLTRVIPLVQAGDTIYLADGTYNGITIDGATNTNFKGTAVAPITIKAQGSNCFIAARTNTRGNFYLNNTSYITVDGIKTSGGRGSLSAGIAVRYSDHITVRNCTAWDNSMWGIFTAGSPNIVIENNETYGSLVEHGIYVADATASHDQPIVRNNSSHDNPGQGIHMNGDAGGTGYFTGAIIEGNVIYNNGTAGGAGINMDGVQNSIIRNNLLYNNHASGIAMYRIDGAAGPKDMEIFNNTIDMASDSRWAIRLANSEGPITIKNNIIYNRNLAHGAYSTNTATDVANLTADNNIIVGSYAATPDDEETFYTLAQWKSLGKDTHSTSQNINALFVSLGTDYHLSANSPAIDKGQTLSNVTMDITGTPRPQGASFDIGAYEYILNQGVSSPKNLGIKSISQ
jgi:parallel beta-helix repeat protein